MRVPGDRLWRGGEENTAPGRRLRRSQAQRRWRPTWTRALRGPRVLAIGAALVALVVVGAVIAPRLASGVRTALRSDSQAGAALIEPSPPSLYYTMRTDDQAGVRAIGATGGSRAVTAGGERAGALISPDGRRAVYLRAGCPRCAAVYEVQNLATGQQLVVGDVPPQPIFGADAPQAAWSADGRYLAFVEHGLDAAVDRIYLYDVYSGVRRPLTTQDPAAQLDPVWSPDGRSVAYLSDAAQTVVSTADVQTGAVRRLNDQLDHARSLAWSPNGAYLALLQAGQIWLIQVTDGHGFVLPAPGAAVAIGGWAPASQALLVVVSHGAATGADQSADLLVAPLNGRPVTRLAEGEPIGSARWSPDGDSVAWAVNQATGWSVWSVAVSGGAARRLASGAGSVTLTDWR